eukprot:210961-Amphidinium_carterae.2
MGQPVLGRAADNIVTSAVSHWCDKKLGVRISGMRLPEQAAQIRVNRAAHSENMSTLDNK